jgi:hypothetical protein
MPLPSIIDSTVRETGSDLESSAQRDYPDLATMPPRTLYMGAI